MDDGVELLADLYLPVGAVNSAAAHDRDPLPVRPPGSSPTPRRWPARASPSLVQSCRGTRGPAGRFVPQVDEQRDGMATHRWVRRQPWFTGTVATYGESYLGYTQWAVAGRMRREDPDNAPDALCLIVTMADFGAITWDNGAFALVTRSAGRA